MGIVEGLTEFLPVSSTGHLIITGDLLKFLEGEQRELFEIFIQLGAILAVCWEYRKKLTHALGGITSEPKSRQFWMNLVMAFIPAAVLGLLFAAKIKEYLFSPVPVAAAFVIGGFTILWAERRKHTITVNEVDEMTGRDALKIGLAQCFALIPGTSRSGATIIGGLLFGLSRKAATEFSFFLAIPTLTAAALYDLYKHRALLDADLWWLLTAGFAASFVFALLAVRGLMRYISHNDFVVFAWYRIVFGLLVLLTAYLGLVKWEG
jgi:undecaprenyl-diphosphatase